MPQSPGEATAASEGRRHAVCPSLGRESEGAVRGGGVKEERSLVLGVQTEVSEEIEERAPAQPASEPGQQAGHSPLTAQLPPACRML